MSMLSFLRKIRRLLNASLPAIDYASQKAGDSAGKPASPFGRYLLYALGEIFLVVIGILIALHPPVPIGTFGRGSITGIRKDKKIKSFIHI